MICLKGHWNLRVKIKSVMDLVDTLYISTAHCAVRLAQKTGHTVHIMYIYCISLQAPQL